MAPAVEEVKDIRAHIICLDPVLDKIFVDLARLHSFLKEIEEEFFLLAVGVRPIKCRHSRNWSFTA